MVWTPLPPLAIALLYFRSCAGWSRDQLAQAVGTTRKRITEWEAGHRTLSRKKTEAFLAVLGYSPADLDQALGEIARRRAQAQGGLNTAGPESAGSAPRCGSCRRST
jgi:transcriptional regulator with XRE-family HTH domain